MKNKRTAPFNGCCPLFYAFSFLITPAYSRGFMTCKVSINSAMIFIVLNVLTVVFTDIEFIQPRNVVLVNHSLPSTINPL